MKHNSYPLSWLGEICVISALSGLKDVSKRHPEQGKPCKLVRDSRKYISFDMHTCGFGFVKQNARKGGRIARRFSGLKSVVSQKNAKTVPCPPSRHGRLGTLCLTQESTPKLYNTMNFGLRAVGGSKRATYGRRSPFRQKLKHLVAAITIHVRNLEALTAGSGGRRSRRNSGGSLA